ncbi:MAG: SRPBCC family protein [Candidatus Binatia bacterium]
MLKKILLGLAALVALLVVVIAARPAAFHISRSITIQAPPSRVFPRLESPRAQNAWSPWVHTDPKMVVTYDGPFSGVGATSAWDGPTAGRGRATITAVTPDREVRQTVEFLSPMQATNRVAFTLVPNGDATVVTWSMDGTNGFIGKAFALFLDIDKMVGDDFEKGLATLKGQVENGA